MHGDINRDWTNVDWYACTSDFDKRLAVSATVNSAQVRAYDLSTAGLPPEAAMSTATEILAQMIEAKRMLDALPPITTERRMHPDDIDAMCRQFGVAKAASPFISFTGIKIIPDESAERLPRVEP